MDTLDDVGYRTRAAVTLRGILNDLKRNEEVAARELGVDPDVLERALAGRALASPELIGKAVRAWPVNERDFFPLHDDAPGGVIVMRAAQSAATARVLRRGGVDYYEYRDTAMSRVSSIRPEWIAMLQAVGDTDPDNPLVRWNNGHFLYQFTYFVGEVNYYYAWGGKRFCVPMTTGDSVFGLPFARHSFAARRAGAPALILALTYGGKLGGDAQHELSALGGEAVEGALLPLGDARRTQAAKLRELMANGSISAERLAQDSGIEPERLAALLRASAGASGDEAEALARALRVPLRELEARLLEPDVRDGVRIVRAAEAPSWSFPSRAAAAYEIRELAGSRITPYARSIELRVLNEAAAGAPELEVGLHQYGYVIGTSAVVLRWRGSEGEAERALEPGDSFFVKPFVPCAFAPVPGREASDARVVLLRAGGKLVGDAALEASQIGAAALHRLVAEAGMWYDAEGGR